MISNQKGNMTFSGIAFIFVIFSAVILTLENKLLLIKKSKDLGNDYLCTKEYLGEYRSYKNKIEKTNNLIFTLNTTKKASLLIPGFGVVSASQIQKIEHLLMKSQDVIHFSYLKFLFHFRKKRCIFSPNIYKSPSELVLAQLKRDKFNRVILRGDKWNVLLLGKSLKLSITHSKDKDYVQSLF